MSPPADPPRRSTLRWTRVGAIALALGVLTGAFGAHGLKARLSAEALGWWQIAVNYHLIHALGLLAVDAVVQRGDPRWANRAGVALVVGLALFSGSLYALALTGTRWLGAITPIGGTAWIAAWLALAWATRRRAPSVG